MCVLSLVELFSLLPLLSLLALAAIESNSALSVVFNFLCIWTNGMLKM